MLTKRYLHPAPLKQLALLVVATGLTLSAKADINAAAVGTDANSTVGVEDNLRDFLSANRGTNGGGDQSLQGGDVLFGTETDDLLIGAIGIDILVGSGGDDILIGGTEDFNPRNRDRGFGGSGDDVFIWAPGDGNDFFDGSTGTDVLMLGVIGEKYDADGSGVGAPFFNVSPPNVAGSQDFDGIYTDAASGLPIVNVAGGPGFCDVVDGSGSADEQAELDALKLDHLVRFTLRGPAADPANPDTGLRIAMHIVNTEFLVCGGETAGDISVLDLTTSPPTVIDATQLPALAYNIIQ